MDLLWGPSPHPAPQGASTAAPTHRFVPHHHLLLLYLESTPSLIPGKVPVVGFGQSRARLSDCHLPMTAEPPRHHECPGRRVCHHARHRRWRRPDAAAEVAGGRGYPRALQQLECRFRHPPLCWQGAIHLPLPSPTPLPQWPPVAPPQTLGVQAAAS